MEYSHRSLGGDLFTTWVGICVTVLIDGVVLLASASSSTHSCLWWSSVCSPLSWISSLNQIVDKVLGVLICNFSFLEMCFLLWILFEGSIGFDIVCRILLIGIASRFLGIMLA